MKIVAEHIVLNNAFLITKVYETELIMNENIGGEWFQNPISDKIYYKHSFYFEKNGENIKPLTTEEFVEMRDRYAKVLINDLYLKYMEKL
jgi:hypothetical protein